MNVPESDARASSFFLFLFSVPDCWCLFTGITVHQLRSFAVSRKHEVRAGTDAGMARHVCLAYCVHRKMLYVYIFIYVYVRGNINIEWKFFCVFFFLATGAPLGAGALLKLCTLRIGSGGAVNMIDTTWGRIYFLTCENFRREFRTQCAMAFNPHGLNQCFVFWKCCPLLNVIYFHRPLQLQKWPL